MAVQPIIIKPDSAPEESEASIAIDTHSDVAVPSRRLFFKSKDFIAICLVVIVVFVAGVLALVLHGNNKMTAKSAAKASVTASTSASNENVLYASKGLKTQSQINEERETDLSILGAGISQYIAGNSSQYPTKITPSSTQAYTVIICGPNCVTPVSIQMGLYEADDVALKTYSAKLAVASVDDAYIVTGTYCDAAATGLGPKLSAGASPAFAILYALQNGVNIKPECMTN